MQPLLNTVITVPVGADVARALATAPPGATIALAPATLIASIFGMNFEALAWLEKAWGPWAALGLMLAAPAALFAIARWRKWF
jgi:hypothetical protein